ncbi:MAG: 4Fe-4S binding protein [Motiliproteus sp.]
MTINEMRSEANLEARSTALTQVGPAMNLAAPTVSYEAGSQILLVGAEHRIRLAADLFAEPANITCLITEPMPENLDQDMEAAAELAQQQSQLKLFHFPLKSIKGYLGKFQVLVDVNSQSANLAELVTDGKAFDAVLDLNQQAKLDAVLKPAGYVHPDFSQGRVAIGAAVEEVADLQGHFEKPRYIQINNDLCAHSRSGMSGCTRCLDVCPADAIDVFKEVVNIDVHLCHGAGGCATACPTSAIRYGYPQPQLLLEQTRQLLDKYQQADGDGAQLLIHDAEIGSQWLADNLNSLPGHWLPLQIEELGAAGLDLWLSALCWGAGGVTLLSHAKVPDSIRVTIDQEVEVANRILQGLGFDNQISIVSLEIENDWQQPVLSSGWPMSGLSSDNDKRQQISKAAAYLYQHSSVVQEKSDSLVSLRNGAPYGSVEINLDNCTLCMSCVSNCPTKALSSNSERPELSFIEDHCVQCGLCEKACPEKVISLQPRYQLDPELRRNSRVLKEEEPFCCVSCGKAFATHGMVNMMIERLAGHSMWGDGGLERLKMCEDCRVVDMVTNDPSSDLYQHARGNDVLPGAINPLIVGSTQADSSQANTNEQKVNASEPQSEAVLVTTTVAQQGGES